MGYFAGIFGLFCLFPSFALAQKQITLIEQNLSDYEVNLIAMKRLYPGGRDEGDLKFQPLLPPITRKINPASDPSDEPEVND